MIPTRAALPTMTIPRCALFTNVLIRCNTIHQSGSRRFRTEAPQILFEKKDHVAKLTLNRPTAANAMGSIIMQEFNHIMEDLEGCIETRSVILTSCSQKVFSAGADLKERAGMTPIEAQATVNNLRTSLQRFASLPMPTMAVVEGVAVGGGMELAVAADFVIASRTSIFGMPETALGIIPGAGGTQRVPRLVGISRALELAVTARRFDGQAAYDYGIVQHLVEPGTADDKAMK